MNAVRFLSTARYLPGKVLTNDDLSRLVETNDEWITTRTGIKRRRINEGGTNLDMAAAAARKAICRAGIDESDLCCLVFATFSPDTFAPSMAACLHEALDLPETMVCFDVNGACPGFVVALHVARGMLLQSPGGKALVVASENISDYIDWTDRRTCVLFGDGAAAAVIDLDEEGSVYFSGGTQSNTQAIRCMTQPDSEDFHVVRMNGREVFRFAVTIIERCINDLLAQAHYTLEDIDHVVCHQANYRIIKHVWEHMKVDSSKFYVNVSEYGNTSAASIPIALDEMSEKGLLKRGDTVICVGFGAGLVWEGVLLKW